MSGGIMVFAPHPDDDVIIAAGVTSTAKQRGEDVTVVYMTNGDFNSISAGNIRQTEAVNAQVNYLGLAENNLIFLGYPDGGLNSMYQDYPNATDVFLDAPSGATATYANKGLGSTDYHNYIYGTHADYNGYNITNDVKNIIMTQRPEHIITTASFDEHSDHSTTYQIVMDAVRAVIAIDPTYAPIIDLSLVHFDDNLWPNDADPQSYTTEPPNFIGTGVRWADRESLDVSLSMQSTLLSANPKYLAIQAHASQVQSGYIDNFLHKDEFFWSFNLNGTNLPPRVDAGLDRIVAQGSTVTLDGSKSIDPDSSILNYNWRQVSGTAVTLLNATTATPSFIVPQDMPNGTIVSFELIVDDGTFDTLADYTSVYILTPYNIATLATVTASSENISASQQAIKAIDGIIDGYPNNYSAEWATTGQGAGAWIKLNWSSAYTVSKVVLHDRPNLSDQITSATLTFSDGTTKSVGVLDNNGLSTTIIIDNIITSSLQVTVNTVSGTTYNVGLSELEIIAIPYIGTADTNIASLATVTASSENISTSQQAIKAIDGIIDGYPNNYSAEWATTGQGAGAWIKLNWSSAYTVSKVVLHDRPNLSDQITSATLTFSDGTTKSVGVLDNGGAGTSIDVGSVITNSMLVTVTTVSGATYNVGLSELEVYGVAVDTNITTLATVTASSENTSTSQQAIKAIDGIIDGYPNNYSAEWATTGQGAGAWIKLNWTSTYDISKVVLYDRPNLSDQITSATLTFSDGTTKSVGVLDNSGLGTTIDVGSVTTNSILVTVTTVSGTTHNVGLSELEVYGTQYTVI